MLVLKVLTMCQIQLCVIMCLPGVLTSNWCSKYTEAFWDAKWWELSNQEQTFKLKWTMFWWKWSSISVLQNETSVSSCTWGSGLTATLVEAWQTTSRTALLFHLKSMNYLCGVIGVSGAEWYPSHQLLMVIHSVASGQLCCSCKRGLKKQPCSKHSSFQMRAFWIGCS